MGRGRPRGYPKTGGRQKGVLNKVTAEQKRDLAAVWEPWFLSTGYVANLEARILAGRAPHMETFLTQKIFGKAVELVQHGGEVQLPVRVVHEYQLLSS